MKNCQTCQFWTTKSDDKNEVMPVDGYGYCQNGYGLRDGQTQRNEKRGLLPVVTQEFERPKEVMPRDGFGAYGWNDDPSACIITGADFGCVKHKNRRA